MLDNLNQKTNYEKRWIAVSVLLMVFLTVLVGLFFWIWQRSQTPISITSNEQDQVGMQTFQECFDSEDSQVVFGKNYGDPALCIGPNGENFTEPTDRVTSRFQGEADAYGDVESWEIYTNEEYGFTIKYPAARYDLVTENYFWNPSAVIFRNKQNIETFYSLAIETPISEKDAMNRFGKDTKSKMVKTDNGYVVLVILDDQDPYLPLMIESFEQF